MKNNNRRFPWFRTIFLVYILLVAGAICYGLFLLWNFLSVYEDTRPVHSMENTLTIFEDFKTEDLQNYLTNEISNPYEDPSGVLDMFYDSIKGKELSFGKLSGSYTESHPVYAVLADGAHVATVSFTSDNTEVDYNLCGWTLESISLSAAATKSFAVTVPSSMNVQINGIPVAKEHIVSTVETDTPVSYVNYAYSGLYQEPDIQVTDRYGNPVLLQKDETTGGLYYKLAYVSAPSSMTLSFGGHVLGEENTLEAGIEVKELSFLPQIAERFSEYKTLPEVVTIPTFTKYYIDFAYTEDSILCTDHLGTERTLTYDAVTHTYSHDLVSDDSLQDECKAIVTDFLQKYALFCSERADDGSGLKPFFPNNSQYCKLIISMDNDWFGAHSTITFENHELLDFFAYSENLVYIQMSIDEKVDMLYTEDKTIKLTHPIWLVKMNGKWYIARIIFESFTVE